MVSSEDDGEIVRKEENYAGRYTEVFVSDSDRVVVMQGEYNRSAKQFTSSEEGILVTFYCLAFDHASYVTANVAMQHLDTLHISYKTFNCDKSVFENITIELIKISS